MGWYQKFNIHVIGVPKWEERYWYRNNIWRNKGENFPNFVENIDLQIKNISEPQSRETQWKPANHNQIDRKHMVRKKSWKQPEKNDILLTRDISQITADFSSGTMEARRQWNRTSNNLKELSTQTLNPLNITFKANKRHFQIKEK